MVGSFFSTGMVVSLGQGRFDVPLSYNVGWRVSFLPEKNLNSISVLLKFYEVLLEISTAILKTLNFTFEKTRFKCALFAPPPPPPRYIISKCEIFIQNPNFLGLFH